MIIYFFSQFLTKLKNFIFINFIIILSANASSPYSINASELEYSEGLFNASGGVTGTFSNIKINAESINGNTESQTFTALGDIKFKQNQSMLSADKLTYNYLNQTGNFENAQLNIENIILKSDLIEKTSTNNYYSKLISISTCPLDKQCYNFSASDSNYDGNTLIAKNMILRVKDFPIIYLPYWKQKIDTSGLKIDIGNKSNLGVYAIYDFININNKNIRSNTKFHAYSNRGGALSYYLSKKSNIYKFEFNGFYIKDQDPYARYSTSEYKGKINDDRFRLKFDGSYHLSNLNYIQSRFTYLSDPCVIEEFFREEYRYYAQPESKFSWVYAAENFSTELFINKRLNKYYDNNDRVEFLFDIYRHRIGKTPIYYQGKNYCSYLENKYVNNSSINNNEIFRFLSEHNFYMPKRIGFVSIVPRVEFGFYSYLESLDKKEEFGRNYSSSGIKISYQASRLLNENQNRYGYGLRHTIKPYLDFNHSNFSAEKNINYQYDFIDSFDDQNRVRLGINQLFQTKVNNKSKRFVELDIYANYIINENNGKNFFNRLYADGRFSLTPNFSADYIAIFDVNNDNIPLMISSILYDSTDIDFSFSHLYKDDDDKSIFTSRFELYPNQKFSVESYLRYEEKDNDLEAISLTLYSNSSCMRYGIGYRMLREDEKQILLSINLLETISR